MNPATSLWCARTSTPTVWRTSIAPPTANAGKAATKRKIQNQVSTLITEPPHVEDCCVAPVVRLPVALPSEVVRKRQAAEHSVRGILSHVQLRRSLVGAVVGSHSASAILLKQQLDAQVRAEPLGEPVADAAGERGPRGLR